MKALDRWFCIKAMDEKVCKQLRLCIMFHPALRICEWAVGEGREFSFMAQDSVIKELKYLLWRRKRAFFSGLDFGEVFRQVLTTAKTCPNQIISMGAMLASRVNLAMSVIFVLFSFYAYLAVGYLASSDSSTCLKCNWLFQFTLHHHHQTNKTKQNTPFPLFSLYACCLQCPLPSHSQHLFTGKLLDPVKNQILWIASLDTAATLCTSLLSYFICLCVCFVTLCACLSLI